MTTKNEYIASIMLEAAELLKLDESAGANGAGARFYDEKIKAAQNKINSLEKKAKAYERAGYDDRGAAKEVKDLKNKIEFYKNQKKGINPKSEYDKDFSGRNHREVRAEASRKGQTVTTSRNNIFGVEYDKKKIR